MDRRESSRAFPPWRPHPPWGWRLRSAGWTLAENGAVIGREARSRGVSVALQPFINIDRDLNYGRGYNTFGEDPFLTGEMGAAEIVGIQSQGVLSQAKHFVGYDTDATNVFIDDQTLHEVYLAPFAAASKAGVSSIMCSYNKINGPYSCGNSETLTKILKGQIGFKGFVTSDWGATHATDFINAGLDMEMSGPLPVPFAGPSYFVNGPKRVAVGNEIPDGPALSAAGLPEEPAQKGWEGSSEPWPTTDLKKLVAAGVVSEDTITRAAGRVLVQMDRFGLLDGKNKLGVTSQDNTEDAKIVEKTAIDAAILLKNDGGALPLKAGDLEKPCDDRAGRRPDCLRRPHRRESRGPARARSGTARGPEAVGGKSSACDLCRCGRYDRNCNSRAVSLALWRSGA
jgi:beta-glucosidase